MRCDGDQEATPLFGGACVEAFHQPLDCREGLGEVNKDQQLMEI